MFIMLYLNKSPFDKTKCNKHNYGRNIYSPYRRNYTPDWLKNRFGYFIKECCRRMMWIVWDPCQDDPYDKHHFVKSYNFSNKSKFHRNYPNVKENLSAKNSRILTINIIHSNKKFIISWTFYNRRSFMIILKDLFTVLILQVPVDILLLHLHFLNSSHILRLLSPLLKHRLPGVHFFQEIYRVF